MSADAIVGFWSYAHEDNKLDDGAIIKLAHLITEEFTLLSGESLNLFIDRDSIAWGEAWRERINSALAQTTFFIPIITPGYFSRPECRRELLEFAAKAKSLGVDELLLPILYVKPPGFSEENPDQAVAFIAKTQYVDWQRKRLLDHNSRKYRKAVNALVHRLIKISQGVADSQFDREFNANLEGDETDGVTELADRVTALLPEWLDAVIGDKFNDAQIEATWHQYLTQAARLRKAHSPASAITAVRMRTGKELLPLAERNHRDAKLYLERSMQLDPYVSALSRLVHEYPDSYALVLPIREGIDEAIANIRRGEMKGGHPMSDHFQDWKHLGRVFQRLISLSSGTNRMVDEGNNIVRRWDSELGRLAPTTRQDAAPLPDPHDLC